MKERKFELKKGALLVDVVSGDNAKMATHHNLTDELALYHLRTNPKSIRLFAKYPENWEALEQAEAEAQPKVAEAEVNDNEAEGAALAQAEAEAQPKAKKSKKK